MPLAEAFLLRPTSANQSTIDSYESMKALITKLLLLLAIAMVAMATNLPEDSTATAVTVTVTELACMTGGLGEATPLAVANALATAADVTAAASLVASIMAEHQAGWDSGVHEPTAGTTTVTTFASATNCPPKPTFDTSPTGELAALLDDAASRIKANSSADATDIVSPNQPRNVGTTSLCVTDSDIMVFGGYGIYIDGWGQDPDGCGKGILDNIRGHCMHGVDRWGCDHWGSGVKLHFRLTAGTSGCALDGIWQASPHDNRENGLCCSYMGGSLVYGGNHACVHAGL